jgi:uncharacterized protein
MKIESKAKLLRIFLGDSDKIHHKPLYEIILEEAKKYDLAGATVFKGVMSYGPTSRIHKAKLLALSTDLPIIIEIADYQDNINDFLPILDDLFEKSNCGGLITIEDVEIIKYTHKKG